MRFLKDYSITCDNVLPDKSSDTLQFQERTVLEYYKVGSDRAQIAFKQTINRLVPGLI